MTTVVTPSHAGRDLRGARRGEAGYTLIELLVAIFLFGIVLAAVTGAFISSARSVGAQRLRTAATRLGTARLETLRSFPFDDIEAQAAAQPSQVTAHGRVFTIDTAVTRIDAATGQPAAGGRVKQITANVAWAAGVDRREVSFTTAVAAAGAAVPTQAIGTVTMYPSPATTDVAGRPLTDIEVTVPLTGFDVGMLVQVSWANADGTAGAKTLTSTTGLNWRGTIARDQVLAALLANGSGEVQFRVSAGSLSTVYSLAVQRAAADPPAITAAAIDRNPIAIAAPGTGPGCAGANRCQNTTDVTFTATVTGLDPSQDSLVVQYQLYDRTFIEVPLAPVPGVSGQWRLVVRQKTTKFLAGTARAFRFTAIRSADGATSSASVRRDVIIT